MVPLKIDHIQIENNVDESVTLLPGHRHQVHAQGEKHDTTMMMPAVKLKKRSSGYILKEDTGEYRKTFLVQLSKELKKIWSDLIKIPNSFPFHHPVSDVVAPRYHEFIKCPMDLDTIRKKLVALEYENIEMFMNDIFQIHTNCEIYNGPDHLYTGIATQLVKTAELRMMKARTRIQIIVENLKRILK